MSRTTSRTSCLAGIADVDAAMFDRILLDVGALNPPRIERTVDVTLLGRLAPDLLICDVDRTETDALELLRRLRFVLPDAIIAVYTGVAKRTWALACHLAGASALLAKSSTEHELGDGLREAIGTGCFTDAHFAGT